MTGRNVTAHEISVAAEEGDRDASLALGIYEDRLARSLAHVVNILDPDRIVLGGGLSNVLRFYQNVPDLIEHYVISRGADVQVVPAVHGDSSGVRGAALLWPFSAA